VKDPANRN